ncbi:MAG: oligosaccharide flippase family protein [Nitrospirales bacterium]|nr:oligosaccharide flippase family protein [Nitrospirales bacterium]
MSNVSNKNVIALLLFSVGSFALSYATAIVFARTLGANGYDDYAVAVSAAAILSTLAEMSTGKYALRIMPAYTESQCWPLASGYLRFSIYLIFLVSLLVALFTVLPEFFVDGKFGNYALGLLILFLPVMAWVGAGSEFVMANQAPIRSAFVTRLLVPGTTLVIGVTWVSLPVELTPPRAVLCYGIGWLVGLIAVAWFLRQTMRLEIREARPEYRPREWLVDVLPFLFFALLITVLAKVGVIILEIVYPQEEMVAVYAVAAETGGFIYLVAKSTDKMFLPDVSLLIERRDVAGIFAGNRRRWTWIGSICVLFLLTVFFFGKDILLLFGEEFVSGYPALCIIAVATSVWTMASIAPSYLKYVKKQKFVLIATTLTVVAHIGLCIPLGYWFGATGAALSYAIPVIAMYLTMGVIATYEARKMENSE